MRPVDQDHRIIVILEAVHDDASSYLQEQTYTRIVPPISAAPGSCCIRLAPRSRRGRAVGVTEAQPHQDVVEGVAR